MKATNLSILLCILLTASLLPVTDCPAQSYPISVLNVNNGLLSGTVECGLYDARGFVWIGTRQGLHRFDGKNVFPYLPDITDPSSIQSMHIMALAEDYLGHIWIVGDKGVDVFLPEENCFEHLQSWQYDAHVYISLLNSLDMAIIQGFLGKGRSVVISLSMRRFLDPATELNNNQRSVLMKSWLAWDNIKDPIPPLSMSDYDFRSYITIEKDEIIRTTSNPQEICVSSLKKGGFTRFIHGRKDPVWQPVNHSWPEAEKKGALAVLEYNDTLAVAGLSKAGIMLFDKRSGDVIRSWDFNNHPELNRQSSIDFLMCDPMGRVWFSIMPYGVFVLDPLSPRFQLLKNTTPNTILHQSLIRSLQNDTLGYLWIGYHDGHIQVLDPGITHEIAHAVVPTVPNKPEVQVSVIDNLPDGAQLINLHNRASLKSKTLSIEPLPFHDIVSFGNFPHASRIPEYYPIHEGIAKGKLRILTRDGGFAIPLPLRIDYPMVMHYLTDKKAFFTSPANCFGILDISGVDSARIIDRQCHDFRVIGIYQDEHTDTLWLATTKGLGIYNKRSFSFHLEDTRHWPSNYLYGILPDEYGNLWISSNSGIIRYNPHTKATRFIGPPEGMQSNEFNTNCSALMKDGSLAFAGPEGLNVFHPSYFEDREEPFYLYVDAIKVNEKEKANNPFEPQLSITLEPRERSLEIHYSSTKYIERTGLKYFVQLQGADPDWVDQGDRESVRYINLKPKTYQLRIKAIDGNGNWSENEIHGTVTMRPTFFQTTWFLLSCFLVLMIVVYAIYQYRMHQLKRIMAIRNRISRDLHDDIGSTLGSISIYSEVAKHSIEENRLDVLDKIGGASRDMIEKLNDIVWSINPENDTLEKMEKRMRSYAVMILNPLGIGFNLTLKAEDLNIKLDMEKRKNIFLIFKEAVHNAAKYADCRQIYISLEETKGQFRMEIRDDGKGFDPTQIEAYNGNGFRSMKGRAEAIGARLVIESYPGAGTRIQLS